MTRKFTVLLIALLAQAFSCPAADPSLEYKVKAVCILNTARFVEWPPSSFKNASAPFVIGVLGDNPFGGLLEEAVKNETVRRRPIVVRQVKLENAADQCQILFVCRSEKDRLPAIFGAVGKAPVLTISELEGFTKAGGVLALALEGGKIRFDLNPAPARAADLRIEPQFLLLCHMKP